MSESPRLPDDPPATPSNAPRTDSNQTTQHTSLNPAETKELLKMLGDEYTYEILEAVIKQPRTGRELIDLIDASKPTVYRRLGTLEEAGLIKTTMQIASDGNHRKQFHAVLSSVTVRFDADGFGARLDLDSSLGASNASATGAQPFADD